MSKATGSSPRLWGTAWRAVSEWARRRFIPTPVGNGAARPSTGSWSAVHPHACGERDPIWWRRQLRRGSSPRLWGTDLVRAGGWRRSRFIPTPVGNGARNHVTGQPGAVHPHACGERLKSRIRAKHGGGSSPRLWGTVVFTRRRYRQRRFIPTPVGNGHRRAFSPTAQAVHPHACGERQPSME